MKAEGNVGDLHHQAAVQQGRPNSIGGGPGSALGYAGDKNPRHSGGRLEGLEHDYATLQREGKQDADLFQLHLGQLIKNAVALAAAANVTFAIHHVDGHDLCRVHADPSAHPVWAEVTVAEARGQLAKKQTFFFRYNNGTRSIEAEVEVQRDIAQRWGTDPEAG